MIVVHLEPNGKLRINEEPISLHDLGPRMRIIMENRAEHEVFILANDDTPYKQVAAAIDTLAGSTQHLYIGILTSGLISDFKQTPFALCYEHWPALNSSTI